MRRRAVPVGLHVVAAREDQPVERFEHLVDPVLVRWHEHGPASGALHRAHVAVRHERRLDVLPVAPRRGLDVRRDPDQGLAHPRSNMRSRS